MRQPRYRSLKWHIVEHNAVITFVVVTLLQYDFVFESSSMVLSGISRLAIRTPGVGQAGCDALKHLISSLTYLERWSDSKRQRLQL
jgi:hypothetical protein